MYDRIRTKETRSRLIIKYYTVMIIGVRSDFIVVAPGNDYESTKLCELANLIQDEIV